MGILRGIGDFRILEEVSDMHWPFQKHPHEGTSFLFQIALVADGRTGMDLGFEVAV